MLFAYLVAAYITFLLMFLEVYGWSEDRSYAVQVSIFAAIIWPALFLTLVLWTIQEIYATLAELVNALG